MRGSSSVCYGPHHVSSLGSIFCAVGEGVLLLGEGPLLGRIQGTLPASGFVSELWIPSSVV